MIARPARAPATPPALALAALLLLAACGDDAPAVDAEGREASGEVLEGSISDAMVPLGEVRSQAPQAEGEDGAEEEGEGDGSAAQGTGSARAEASEDTPADNSPAEEAAEPAPAADEPAAEN